MSRIPTSFFSILFALTLPISAWGSQILQASGFTTCLSGSNMTVQNLYIQYNADNKTVSFDVAGTSTSVQNVTAQLNVTAYGVSVYDRFFNPCSESTFVDELCPVPAGVFSARGTQLIPDEYASQIPSIAFTVPDISATATLQLKSLDSSIDVACLQAQITNGKTASAPAISFVAAGIAGAALIVTGGTAAGAAAAAAGGGTIGAGSMTPSFTEVFVWFQGLAMNGMMSVNYPPVYRSFSKNFAFSAGIIPWKAMQTKIDNFRAQTGGNLTVNSVESLKNASLGGANKLSRRAFKALILARDSLSTSANYTDPSAAQDTSTKIKTTVSGIKSYMEELSVPETNTFMTVLLILACTIAAIATGILLFKVFLELWALFGSLPKGLVGFRKHYWATMARIIVQLILVLYGIWVLYCIYQFTHGDSWAAKLLAATTLAIFSGILGYFAYKIGKTAKKLKEQDGDASGLYEKKEMWLKYSMFYESYRKDYWWLFLPTIVYMFAKGSVLAAADGHGFTQTIAQLVIEMLMLGLLIWSRPYERRSGNLINIFIQVVRALSIACIFVFVEELGISQTTQTVTGVVLIAVQSILTGVLAILIATNAIIMCFKPNPHRKRRKEAEKSNKDKDNFIPLGSGKDALADPEDFDSKSSFHQDSKNIFLDDSRRRKDSYIVGSQKRITQSRGLIDSTVPTYRVARTDQEYNQQKYRGVAF